MGCGNEYFLHIRFKYLVSWKSGKGLCFGLEPICLWNKHTYSLLDSGKVVRAFLQES